MTTQFNRRHDDGSSEEPQVAPNPEPGDELDDVDRPRTLGESVLAGLKEILVVVVLAMVLSLVVKTWLFQAFYIPSGSMEDTLVVDDRVIVSKLTPGPIDLRRGDVVVFEDPGTPGKWLDSQVDPGRAGIGGPFHDLLVFVGLLPEDAENHLIKRVIGLPGDHVQSDGEDGPILVNGVPITESYIKDGVLPSEGKAFDIVVPEGRIWVMGDNRKDSSDSRYHDDGAGRTGSVPLEKVVGRALFIVWPLDHVTWLGVPARTFEKVPDPESLPAQPDPASTTAPAPTADSSAAPAS